MAKEKFKQPTPKEFDALVARRVRDSLGALTPADAVGVVRAQLEHDEALHDAPEPEPAKDSAPSPKGS